MSRIANHSRTGYQFCADPENHHQGQAAHSSAFVPGQTDADSVVHSLNHTPSSGIVEPQHMQTGHQGLQLDYPYVPANGNPQPEAAPEPLVFGTSQQERTLRRKSKCEDLRAKAAYQATIEKPAHTAFPSFESPGFHAVNISLPQPIHDSPSCAAPEPPVNERDGKDGRRTRREHRAMERPISPSPLPSTPIDPRVEIEPRNKSNHDLRYAGDNSQQSHSRPDAQATSQHRAQGAGFLTSQEWQQYPTTHGPGSPYEIARTLRRTAQPQELGVQSEEETASNASTLVAETPFDPIAGLEGFEGVPTIRGEGYHYPQVLQHFSKPPQTDSPLETAVIEGVPYEGPFAEETFLRNVPAHVLRAGNFARVRRGYPESDPSPSTGSSDDVAQQELLHARVPEFTSVPAFKEYSIPAFSWQRCSSKMTEDISMGLRQLALSLCECLYEIDW